MNSTGTANTVYKFIRTVVIAAISAALLSVYNALVIQHGNIAAAATVHFGIGRLTAILFVLALLCTLFVELIGTERLFRYRYLLALLVFLICVVFEITGSSIGIYSGDYGNVLLGVSRPIRSDEWGVFTPMTWAQYQDPSGAFPYFSSAIRADRTDVFLEYGQPVKTWLMIYRPFQIGYLFLPIAKGMAFFWCGRLIGLFMVSFEFGRLITKDDRLLAVVYAVMITFSPSVQWWFAINGFVEMLIAFQLSIVCFDKYLSSDKILYRFPLALVIGICAGMYIMTMYPAWMVPLAYVLLACIVWVIYKNVKEQTAVRLGISDAGIAAVVLTMLVISGVSLWKNSGETFQIIMNTVFPGKRESVGGGIGLRQMFDYFSNIWYSIKDYSAYANTCETASFITLFPVSYIVYGIAAYKRKKSDVLCNLLCLVSLFLLIYCVTGFPLGLAKITMMSKSLSGRAIVIFGLANVIILIRTLSLMQAESELKGEKTKRIAPVPIALSVVLALFGVVFTYRINPEYYNRIMIISEMIIFATTFYGVFIFINKEEVRKLWGVLIVGVCLISGMLVNPVRSGVDDIEKIPAVNMIKEVVQENPEAVWIAEDTGYLQPNMLLMAGARTINSTNVYPDLDRWYLLDPGKEYEDCYNRYAHIQILLKEEEPTEKFTVEQADCLTVNLINEDLTMLHVKYIFSTNDLTANKNLMLLDSTDGFSIYEYKGV